MFFKLMPRNEIADEVVTQDMYPVHHNFLTLSSYPWEPNHVPYFSTVIITRSRYNEEFLLESILLSVLYAKMKHGIVIRFWYRHRN